PDVGRDAGQLPLVGRPSGAGPRGARAVAARRRRSRRIAARALRRVARGDGRARGRGGVVSVQAVAPGLAAPYRGLAPFGDTELDALLFFGRERETEIGVANLIASRLTILYGPSGVGKSSLLRAGVARSVRDRGARDRLATPDP